ncbi:hypothetical protein [Halogranum rubrum]|uniref:hypothetical protein n=1 Tax=Halogranum rubrum TaxID=553466 RepID=UPI0012FC522D|nr:hypothetical protein [Halogranum salarium]
MSDVLRKARRTYRDEGGVSLLKKGFRFGYDNYVRPSLPRRTVSYNGVPVRAAHLGDSLIPWHEMDIPGYEDALVRGIRQHAEKGDSVVIVGGGWGVSTVVAANQVGEAGTIITFEGSREAAKRVNETVFLNQVSDQVEVQHTVVSNAFSLRGEADGAQVLPPSELPDCDMLVLDCEGAESSILKEMTAYPNKILVETHGMLGSPKSEIQECLRSNCYQIRTTRIAEKRLQDFCRQNGIYVIGADRTTS